MQVNERKLSQLRQLEAESIQIIREAAAEFDNPVMMYSVGKDSSVMLRLAEKAFAPGPLPFPLLHVDTTWKFQDMYRFRDAFAERYGVGYYWGVFENEDMGTAKTKDERRAAGRRLLRVLMAVLLLTATASASPAGATAASWPPTR